MSADITLDNSQLMDAFNQGEPWSLFELYALLWPHAQDLLSFLVEDHDAHSDLSFIAFLQFLIIDCNEWTFIDAKASYGNALRQMAAAWRSWRDKASFPLITRHIIRITKAYRRPEILMIFKNLEYASEMPFIYQNIKMVLLDYESSGQMPDWERDLSMAKTHLLLAHLRVYPISEKS